MKSKIKIGEKFTFLTVIEETEQRKRGSKVWKCQCVCGNFCFVKADYLKQEWIKSCGCFRSQRAKSRLNIVWEKNPKKNQKKQIYKFNALKRSYISGAKGRNLTFALSDEQLFALASSPCYYCGFSPNFENPLISSNLYSDVFNGVDRKNSKDGYLQDNCVSCCFICNRAKNDMLFEDFLNYIKRLVEYKIITT